MGEALSQSAAATPPADAPELSCPACGYNLHGTQSDRCPECGAAFDRAALSRAYVPWARRQYAGTLRSYWKTVVAFTLTPGRMARDCGEVSYAEAVKFRAITVVLASLAVIVPGVLWFFEWWPLPAGKPRQPRDRWPLDFFNAPVTFWVSIACVPVFFALATGAAGYFFHPRRLSIREQNGGVALAQFTCAPLAFLLPGVVILSGGILLLQWFEDPRALWHVTGVLIATGAGLAYGSLFVWWINTVRVLRAGVGAGAVQITLAAGLLPIVWAIQAVAVFLIVQFVVSFLVLVGGSLYGRLVP